MEVTMSDVMLPWPQPRRPEPAQTAPHYEIQRVFEDGSSEPVEVVPIVRPPWAAKAGRRGFLGAGIASSVAAALLLGGCDDTDDDESPSSTTTDPMPDSDYDDSPTDQYQPPYEPPYDPP